MRQVPVTPTYGIVGSGKMAKHFAHYCRLKKIPFLQIPARQAADDNTLLSSLQSCQIICLLIKDACIESFYSNHLQHIDTYCLHFSGALTIDGCIGAHPLGVFSDALYSLSDYQSIPFIVEEGAPDFHQIFPGLDNPHFTLTRSNKALYHAHCVLANNFTGYLWQKYLKSMKAMGLDEQAVHHFMRQSLTALVNNPNLPVTGPLGRKDYATIDANLKALEGDSFQAVYQAFISATE